MKNHRAARSALAFAASVLICGSAQAQGLFRAYLASGGLDSNPCTVASPCRLLPAALAAVTDGGEIWMVDSANYNTATVSITKSVTILAVPGAVGSVVSISGAAIAASTPGTSVALRNLVIVPLPGGGGTGGIQVSGAAKLVVEGSVISGHTSEGISVNSQTAVQITNCIIRNNGINGVALFGGATAEISGSKFLNNTQAGVRVFANSLLLTSAVISDSVLSANANGLDVEATVSGAIARASVTRSTLSDNVGNGVIVFAASGATSVVTVGGNMITANGKAFALIGAGATIESPGNNTASQNTNASTGAITPLTPL
jgi:hypothetical protein